MTPQTIAFVERVERGKATYRAAWVFDGRTPEPTGPRFTSPKEAIRYAERLERRSREESAE